MGEQGKQGTYKRQFTTKELTGKYYREMFVRGRATKEKEVQK